MAINKVVDRNNNVLIDLTFDSVTPSKVLSGETFHDKYGNECIGTMTAPRSGELDLTKYNFIDYDGTLLYSYTDTEIDNLSELPGGVDHTDENLTFQGWNWDLEDLKTWNRERKYRPIVGAHYITTDGKTYIHFETPLSNATIKLDNGGTYPQYISIDWGDGTVQTSGISNPVSHTYVNPGEYTIIIETTGDAIFAFSVGDATSSTNEQYIDEIKLGNIKTLKQSAFGNLRQLKKINVPKNIEIAANSNMLFESCRFLKAVVLPISFTTFYRNIFYECYTLETVSLPKNISATSSQYGQFNKCRSLKNVVLPDSVTFLGSEMFGSCYSLKNIEIPETVTEADGGVFTNCYSLNNLKIPNSITKTGTNFCYYCYVLSTIELSNSLTKIEYNNFNSCYCIKYISIPDSVTEIGSSALSGISGTIDLSQQTKVITLTGSILYTSDTPTILVPASLLDQYKSASYWSNYAAFMVGV